MSLENELGLNDVIALVERTRGTRILVVGDIMLDEHIWADVERISPEAPVPVAKVQQVTRVGGGAANVAANIKGLGATPLLVGVVGTDEPGRQLIEWLKVNDIDVSGIVLNNERTTTLKTRVIARNQHLVRIDREEITPVSHEIERQVKAEVLKRLPHSSGLLMSDYAKGVLTSTLCRELIHESRRLGKPVIIDPKGADYRKYENATVLTPNEKEAETASNTLIHDDETLKQAAQQILEITTARWLVVTRGAKGMTIFSKEYHRHVPAIPVEVFDIAGAGDTAVSVIATLLSDGADIEAAVRIANIASSIVIQKAGVAAINRRDLLAQIGSNRYGFEEQQRKIKTIEELETIVLDLKRKGKKIVFTNGCFDLLHMGHIHLLREARKQGDVLIVGLNSDKSVRRLKGRNRPITSERERAELLAALSMVDYVVIFDQDTPEEVLKILQVHVQVKGGDYSLESLPEASVVKAYGGSVVLLPYISGYSTSDIISRIKGSRIKSS